MFVLKITVFAKYNYAIVLLRFYITFIVTKLIVRAPSEQNNANSYTPRTLRACYSQSKFRILKICESSECIIFVQYYCTPNISRIGDASVSVA